MTDREKLIELLQVEIYPHEAKSPAEVVADYLLDNGVILDDGSIPKIVDKKNCRSDNAGWYFNIRLQWHGKDWFIAHEIPTGDLCKQCFMKNLSQMGDDDDG